MSALFNYKLTKHEKKKPIGPGDMKIMGEHKYRGSDRLWGPHQFLFHKG